MADNADDVVDDVIFEGDEEKQESPKTDPSPVKDAKADKPEAVKDTKDEAKADDTAAPPDVPTKDTKADKEPAKAEADAPEAEVTEDKPQAEKQGKAEERKTQLNTEIRDLVAQRNTIRDEVTRLNAETYQPATESELVEGGMTDIEAKVEAMRQEREMDKFNSQVADAQLTIASESDRVLRDFPLFNPESDTYDKELAQAAAGHLSSMLVIDPNTEQVIGSNGSVYQYYNTLARASGISAAKGQIQGQKDTQTMLANTDSTTNAAPPKETKDPLMELWKSDD